MAQTPRVKSLKSRRGSPRANLPHLNSVDEAVIATDLEGKVVFWNSAAETLYGWSWQEVIGRPIVELLVPDSEQPHAVEIMKQLRQGKTWTGPFKLRRKNGTEFVGTVTDLPLRDIKGNLIGIIGRSHSAIERERIARPDKDQSPCL